VDRPWNTVVVSVPVIASGDLSVGIVYTAFNAQVADGNGPSVDFRFRELRAWELSGGNLGVEIYDLANVAANAAEPIRTQHDEPGRNHWASVGLRWPASAANNVYHATSTNSVIANIETSGNNTLVHVHLLWRFTGTPRPTRGTPATWKPVREIHWASNGLSRSQENHLLEASKTPDTFQPSFCDSTVHCEPMDWALCEQSDICVQSDDIASDSDE